MKTINNNIKERMVSFTNAKLLNEKSFEVPCQFLYVGKKHSIHDKEIGGLFDNKIASTQIPNDWFSAPTQQLAIDWILENFGIHFKIEPTLHEKYDIFMQENLGWVYVGNFNTPVEAKEAAINYVLINLI